MSSQCGCAKCLDTGFVQTKNPVLGHASPPSQRYIIVCRQCGHKRCPHASDHELPCAQDGSTHA